MSRTIEEILNGILKAIYGREVRQDIHDGIEMGYQIATESKTAAQQAVSDAEEAILTANTAAEAANSAASSANTAASAANDAADRAEAAAGGDISNKTVTFTQPEEYSAPASGETLGILTGKIAKGLENLQNTTNNIQDHQIAYIFKEEYPYDAGEYVVYNERLYRFTANKTAGAWDSSKVTETVIGNELYDKLDASKVIASTNITQSGFVMDGKTCSDAIAQLNDDIEALENNMFRSNPSSAGIKDANNATESGFYTVGGDWTNTPSGFGVMVVFHTNDYILQILKSVVTSDSTLYVRTCDTASAGWSVWRAVSMTSAP